uniref:Uncharacterized protein n=1 Tax=uncultured marine virus TaxID=186617 RepID=A0A0F7LA93_9VIRU|nr:hypothetical protein [uncultured marine virus]
MNAVRDRATLPVIGAAEPFLLAVLPGKPPTELRDVLPATRRETGRTLRRRRHRMTDARRERSLILDAEERRRI